MNILLITGIVLIGGYVMGRLAGLIGLPKVTGYILAGILMNPGIFDVVPANFPDHAKPVSDFCLAFITLEVGASLTIPKLKELGRGIILITLSESIIAFIFVGAAMWLYYHFAHFSPGAELIAPFSILIAALAAPTDPSATVAVIHEYKASGRVTDTIMGVAALDDAVGIMLFAVGIGVASAMTGSASGTLSDGLIHAGEEIVYGIGIGIIFGLIFNFLTRKLKLATEGGYIVLILGVLAFCYGVADLFKIDGLLSVLALGSVIANFNSNRLIFLRVMEQYTEELIFLFFFTVSGMYLDFSVVWGSILVIVVFSISRNLGKFTGVLLGAYVTKQPAKVRKYAIGGLIPQGGIVVGLALALHTTPAFEPFSRLLFGIVMGATILHEVSGPLFAKLSLKKAGETGPVKEVYPQSA